MALMEDFFVLATAKDGTKLLLRIEEGQGDNLTSDDLEEGIVDYAMLFPAQVEESDVELIHKGHLSRKLQEKMWDEAIQSDLLGYYQDLPSETDAALYFLNAWFGKGEWTEEGIEIIPCLIADDSGTDDKDVRAA